MIVFGGADISGCSKEEGVKFHSLLGNNIIQLPTTDSNIISK